MSGFKNGTHYTETGGKHNHWTQWNIIPTLFQGSFKSRWFNDDFPFRGFSSSVITTFKICVCTHTWVYILAVYHTSENLQGESTTHLRIKYRKTGSSFRSQVQFVSCFLTHYFIQWIHKRRSWNRMDFDQDENGRDKEKRNPQFIDAFISLVPWWN